MHEENIIIRIPVNLIQTTDKMYQVNKTTDKTCQVNKTTEKIRQIIDLRRLDIFTKKTDEICVLD